MALVVTDEAAVCGREMLTAVVDQMTASDDQEELSSDLLAAVDTLLLALSGFYEAFHVDASSLYELFQVCCLWIRHIADSLLHSCVYACLRRALRAQPAVSTGPAWAE